MTYLPTFTAIFITNLYTLTEARLIYDEKINSPVYLSSRYAQLSINNINIDYKANKY